MIAIMIFWEGRMKTYLVAAALVMGAGIAQADPIEGVWQTEADEGAFALVTITPCGDKFCGTISKTYKGKDEYPSPNIGKQIVIGMTPKGDGAYTGQVWRPANDKIYSGKATVSGNAMKLAGCLAGTLFCKTQTWTKIK